VELSPINFNLYKNTEMYLEIVARSIHSKLVRIRLTDKPWFRTEIRKRNKYGIFHWPVKRINLIL
jgi:hypothetical protein